MKRKVDSHYLVGMTTKSRRSWNGKNANASANFAMIHARVRLLDVANLLASSEACFGKLRISADCAESAQSTCREWFLSPAAVRGKKSFQLELLSEENCSHFRGGNLPSRLDDGDLVLGETSQRRRWDVLNFHHPTVDALHDVAHG
jgi:hypothetical protein